MNVTLSPTEGRMLAARATTLDERLAGQAVPLDPENESAVSMPRYEAWVRTTSGGDKKLLADILAAKATDMTTLGKLFGPVVLPEGQKVPEWVETFAWILTALDRQVKIPHGVDTPLPFETFFQGLVAEARRRRDVALSINATAHFTGAALRDFDRNLTAACLSVCGRALLDALALSRHLSGRVLDKSNPLSEADTASEQDQFSRSLKGTTLKAFFMDRPVLARLLATVVTQWIDVTARFIARLAADRMTALLPLVGGADPGRVAGLGCGLSDRHRGGQSVYKVTFETGHVVGYKPKDLSVDKAFNDLLAWMEVDGAPLSAGSTAVCLRPGYGWVKWVQHAACEDEHEARTFFRRSGAMLCLIRMLQGNDFHFENIIACGSVPVPIDLETIMHPRLSEMPSAVPGDVALHRAAHLLTDSVSNIGYLPNYISIPGGGAVKIGGLDDFQENAAASVSNSTRDNPNLPVLNCRPLSVADYEVDFLDGYQAMFGYITENGQRIAASGGPLDGFETCTIRPVLRPTRTYAMIQHRALGRQSVVDGASWSGHFDTLSRVSAPAAAEGEDRLAVLCDYERKSMAGFDVPHYQARPDSADLVCGDGTVFADFFEAPCLETVRARFRDVPTGALARDTLLIRKSLRIGTPARSVATASVTTSDQPTAPELISHAVDLGEALRSSAIRAGGAASWIDLVPIMADDRHLQPQPLGPAAFAGADGIALFFADLFKATGDPVWRHEAKAASALSTAQIRDPSRLQAVSEISPLGLGNGIGGLLLAQTALARAFEDEQHLEAAKAYASTITKTKLEQVSDFSQFKGLSGALSGLAALYRLAPSEVLAIRISEAAAHLAAARSSQNMLFEVWKDNAWRLPQAGLLHGASGIAIALCAAADITGEPNLTDATRSALAYEQSLFETCGGWPDLRDMKDLDTVGRAPVRADFATGAAGIGLARLALARSGTGLDLQSLRGDVVRAGRIVACVRNAVAWDGDGLFTGRAGLALFLARAHSEMPGTVDPMIAPTLVGGMLGHAKHSGNLCWKAGADAENPSFCLGAAGVGSVLLECAGIRGAAAALTFGGTEAASSTNPKQVDHNRAPLPA